MELDTVGRWRVMRWGLETRNVVVQCDRPWLVILSSDLSSLLPIDSANASEVDTDGFMEGSTAVS